MLVVGHDRGVRAKSASRDQKIGQRKNAALSIQLPGEFFSGSPDRMIGRDMDQQVKKTGKMLFHPWTDYAAQHFDPHDITADNFGRAKRFRQLAHRILSVAQKLNVNRRVNENHV
jgi:hypothetical protein